MTINGKKVQPEFKFKHVVALEGMGMPIEKLADEGKTNTLVNAMVSLWLGIDMEQASDEIEEHMESGGKYMDLVDSVTGAIDGSGFFRNIQEGSKKKNRIPQEKKQEEA